MENINSEKDLKYTMCSSAGGKVIISGEHSVVYGKPALAFSIDKFTKMDLKCYKSSQKFNIFASINLLNLKIELMITKSELIEIIDKKIIQESNQDKHIKHIIYVITNFFKKILDLNITNKNRIKNYIYNNYFTITISSEIPVGFGLGSSAAFNVCIINGICSFMNIFYKKNLFSEKDILLLANDGEKIFHNGTPSGIDASCSLYGGVILFRNINDQNKIKISQKNFFFEKIKFLLIDTQIKRDGGDFINIVSNYKKNNLQEFNDAINNIEKVTNSIIKLITKEKSDENDCYEFFELIKQNQKLLKEICVSNNEIDKIVNLLETNGFVGKISGAGGGGFIISFTLIEKISDLIKLLDENSIKYLSVNISKEPAKIIDMKYFSNN